MSESKGPEGVNKELWDFPCTIAFKAMAVNRPGIDIDIVTVVQEILPGDYAPESKPSAKGNYVSITLSVTFESHHQVERVYREVRAIDDVKLCL